jgi:hypothetical protein
MDNSQKFRHCIVISSSLWQLHIICIISSLLQVMLPSACSFIVDVSCHCLTFSCRCFTLHVSAYMAIFRCVGYFYFHIAEGICFAGFCLFCTWSHFARFHLWGGLNITCKTHWTIQCSRMLKYSIISSLFIWDFLPNNIRVITSVTIKPAGKLWMPLWET